MNIECITPVITPPDTYIPRLEIERLILTAHTLDDHNQVIEMWRDPAVTRYILGGQLSTPRETWMRMLSYLGLWSMLGYGYWAIKEKSTGRYVGDLGFADFHRDIEPSTRYIPEAGWALASWAQGKGYATEALLAAIHWLQNTREITSCLCLIEPDNLPSIKLAKRVGFKKSHTLRLNGELTELFILSSGNSTRDKINIAIK